MNADLFIENSLPAILFASIITYAFRFGGLLLADRFPKTGFLRMFLDGLPGAILLSLVVPGAIDLGRIGCIGLAACFFTFWKSGNLLLTMASGVLVVALLRSQGFG